MSEYADRAIPFLHQMNGAPSCVDFMDVIMGDIPSQNPVSTVSVLLLSCLSVFEVTIISWSTDTWWWSVGWNRVYVYNACEQAPLV